jgi:hypothetical protein
MNKSKIWIISRILIYLLLIIAASVQHVTEGEVWELGQYLFNNTILIAGITGVFLEIYRKRV